MSNFVKLHEGTKTIYVNLDTVVEIENAGGNTILTTNAAYGQTFNGKFEIHNVQYRVIESIDQIIDL